jgi:LCP family protein required for cell wall assembly
MSHSPDGTYDWLYEGQPRPIGSTSESSLPPPDLPPPGTAPGGPRPPRPKKGGFGRFLKLTFLLIVLVVIGGAGYLVYVPLQASSQATRVDATPPDPRPAEQPGTTYLIVGSDSRRGLSAHQRREYSTGGDVGARTDTIMLMHTGAGPTTLLSIPRDSLVDIPGYGTTKINAAYAFGGPKLLVQTIEQDTGIRIDSYVEIGFGGLVNVVDAVGGIKICPSTAISDPDAALNIQAGCQWVDGKTALGYARSRHTYLTQDIQRVQAQREVIGAIADEAKSTSTILNPVRYWRVLHGAALSVQVGENVRTTDMARFALGLSAAMSGKGLDCTVPLADFAVNWDAQRAPVMFAHLKNDTTAQIGDLCTKDGLPAK